MSVNNQATNPAPDWLTPGATVEHQHFGQGRVVDLGQHKGVDVVRIEFSMGPKVLSIEYGVPALRPVCAQGAE